MSTNENGIKSIKEVLESRLLDTTAPSFEAARAHLEKIAGSASEHAISCALALDGHLSPGTVRDVLFGNARSGASLTTLACLAYAIENFRAMKTEIRNARLETASKTFFSEEHRKEYQTSQSKKEEISRLLSLENNTLTMPLAALLGFNPQNKDRQLDQNTAQEEITISSATLKNACSLSYSKIQKTYSLTIETTDPVVTKRLQRLAEILESEDE